MRFEQFNIRLEGFHEFIYFFHFFFMTVGIRTRLRAPRLISWSPEVYGRVLTPVALGGLELIIIVSKFKV